MQRLGNACQSSVGVDLVVHVKGKAEDGGQQMDAIIDALKESSTEPLIGVLAKASAHHKKQFYSL